MATLKNDRLKASEMSERNVSGDQEASIRIILEKFERAKILEVYFSRLDGRVPEEIPASYQKLYEVELSQIKNFLLGQHPQDTLLQKVFRMMS